MLNTNNFPQIRLHNSLIKHTGAGFGSGRGSKAKNVEGRWIAGFVKKTQKANRESDENWLCSLSRVYQGIWPRYTRSHIYVHINTHTCVKNALMYPSTKQGFKFQCTLQTYIHTLKESHKYRQKLPSGSVLFQRAAANVFLSCSSICSTVTESSVFSVTCTAIPDLSVPHIHTGASFSTVP